MDGIVLVDKPAGRSSHKVTNDVRRELGAAKAGHAGTLDPFATGLLIVLLGRARRVQRFFMGMSKEYVASARLGAASTTGDPEGEITLTGRFPPERFEPVLGRITQRPPIYSAMVFTETDNRRRETCNLAADDDTPKPPELSPLSSAQARRAWRESAPADRPEG